MIDIVPGFHTHQRQVRLSAGGSTMSYCAKVFAYNRSFEHNDEINMAIERFAWILERPQ